MSKFRLFLQQRPHVLHVFRLQHPSGLTQFQLSQQHVIAGFGQVALGLEELALAVQHVDVDAHAHLIAQFVGVQRRFGSKLRRLPKL